MTATHDFCYECRERQSKTVMFDTNRPVTRNIDVDYCKHLDKVLTPKIKDIAFQLNCKYRRMK